MVFTLHIGSWLFVTPLKRQQWSSHDHVFWFAGRYCRYWWAFWCFVGVVRCFPQGAEAFPPNTCSVSAPSPNNHHTHLAALCACAVYNQSAVRDDFEEPNYAMIDTLFSLAEAYLFMQLVELVVSLLQLCLLYLQIG